MDSAGRDAAGFREFLSAWEDARALAEEYRELDGERVLADLGLAPESSSQPP
jgi:hypothetical protein